MPKTRSDSTLGRVKAFRDAADRARPEPPSNMASSPAIVWRNTLAALPAGFIATEQFPVFEAYCTHVARAAAIEVLLAQEEAGSRQWQALVKVASTVTRDITACARALRLTNQSRYRPEAAASVAASHATAANVLDNDDGLIPGRISLLRRRK